MPTTAAPAVTFDRHGFSLHGQRRFLLTGTLAYYRLDRQDWADRLQWLKAARFNAVDVYVPWNYHEPTEGNFDFATGNRDLITFLRLCGESGLMVYLRPGPYICNEWDGGGLPAWLFTKPDVRLRQDDPAYLSYVRRYLGEINQRVRELQIDQGGPIVLYALENELDFFACDDPAGYLSQLRDMVRQDGITVPLTACIGKGDKVAGACGYADGVIPSPNIYAKDLIERKAVDAAATIHAGQFRNGDSMADLPVFITEMGRDENSLRRMLAGGVKGLGPFNFVGGSNPGFWNGTNNWGAYTQIATVVDSSGMVRFDGRVGRNFTNARRLAGLIQAFETLILTADSITSWEDGPTVDNPRLGVREDDARPGRIYSLVHGDAAFVFLTNTTDTALETGITIGGRTFPTDTPATIPANSTRIVMANVPLASVGLDWTIAYATAELCDLQAGPHGPTMTLCGDADATAEIRLTGPVLSIDSAPAGVRLVEQSESSLALAMRFDQPADFTVTGGGDVLHVRVRERFRAGFEGITQVTALGESVDLAAMPWRLTAVPTPAWDQTWKGDAKSLESLGVLRGAGWYELAFDAPDPVSQIAIDGAGDVVTVMLDDAYVGAWLADGGVLRVSFPQPVAAGTHRLRVRAEIWGHANFDDVHWPACRLGSLRGLQGQVRVNGNPLRHGAWRFAPEPAAPPKTAISDARASTQPLADIILDPGTGRWVSCHLPRDMERPRGAVVTMDGCDCHGELFADDVMIGRFVFGPTVNLTFKGGPANTFFVPTRLASRATVLHLHMRGIGGGGQIRSIALRKLVRIPTDAFLKNVDATTDLPVRSSPGATQE
ncbi:MAG: beta-galactosidase [Phycisphaeraceae bacterium]